MVHRQFRRRRAYLERKVERLRVERAAGATVEGVPEAETGDLESDGPPVSREEINRRKLVRRAHVTTIVTAWVTTVPAAAVLAAVIFLLLDALA